MGGRRSNQSVMSALPVSPRALQRTPNFFLVGAPKAGTTSLYFYLDQHPQIYMSPLKEPHYLADEIRLSNFTDQMRQRAERRLAGLRPFLDGPMAKKFSAGPVTEVADYLKLFQNAKAEDALGEASVCYLWSPSAAGNIARMCPQARILMVLRDPADRAYSQYLHMLTFGKTYISFRDYIDGGLSCSSTLIGELYPFLYFGKYYEQVKRYLHLFPRERIRILFYEDYQRNPLELLQNTFEFLGVDSLFVPDLQERYMQANVPRSHLIHRFVHPVTQWAPLKQLNTPRLRRGLKRLAFRPRRSMTMDPCDRAFLVDFYREDIRNLSDLLNRDLSAWLHTAVN
jgi:hypothetical protein